MSDDKAAVAHRIRSLLLKTVENGCTEEEAILAAQKARELQDKHRLGQSDLEIQKEAVVRREWRRAMRTTRAATDGCMSGIQAYCGVKMWLNSVFEDGQKWTKAVAFGLESDVDMAQYLYDMIRGSINSEHRVYMRRNRGGSRAQSADIGWSFIVGMAARINQRLQDMAADLDGRARTGSGTALVVVKNAIVAEAFAKLNLHFGRRLTGRRVQNGAAYYDGQAVGDRVNLNRPVTGRGPARRLT